MGPPLQPDEAFRGVSVRTPKLISARLGLSSITITLDRYGRLFPWVEEALAEPLDAVYAGTSSPRSVERGGAGAG